MNKTELLQKITEKKEFSKLPKKDVELAFLHFEKRQVSDEEKIRLTRELLHKVFSSFTSSKLLSPKNKDEEWVLRKHLSTRERLPFYSEIYKKILVEYKTQEISIIDLGAGVNGFSYKYFLDDGAFAPARDPARIFQIYLRNYYSRSRSPASASLPLLRPDQKNHPAMQNKRCNAAYIAVESVGQLVEQMNNYFEKNKLNACAIHESLFELEKIKKIITETEKPRIIFLFKVLDSLEMLERDYSKKLLKEIVPLADKVVVSFATMSMIKRKKFKVNRNWILDFIKNNFEILDELELGGERYICFREVCKNKFPAKITNFSQRAF